MANTEQQNVLTTPSVSVCSVCGCACVCERKVEERANHARGVGPGETLLRVQ